MTFSVIRSWTCSTFLRVRLDFTSSTGVSNVTLRHFFWGYKSNVITYPKIHTVESVGKWECVSCDGNMTLKRWRCAKPPISLERRRRCPSRHVSAAYQTCVAQIQLAVTDNLQCYMGSFPSLNKQLRPWPSQGESHSQLNNHGLQDDHSPSVMHTLNDGNHSWCRTVCFCVSLRRMSHFPSRRETQQQVLLSIRAKHSPLYNFSQRWYRLTTCR